MSGLSVVTYATHEERSLRLLLASVPGIVAYGWGVPWTGFRDKCAAVARHCEAQRPDAVVCFLDGFDSVGLAPPAEALVKFRARGCRILFSADIRNDAAPLRYAVARIFGTCRDLALNSGMYIGYAADVAAFWRDIRPGDDDQRYATALCEADPGIAIDTECDVFYNFSTSDALRVSGRRLLVNGAHAPCFLSAPGNADIAPLLLELGFQDPPVPLEDGAADRARRWARWAPVFAPEAAAALAVLALVWAARRARTA
jgi:hypothetical protein